MANADLSGLPPSDLYILCGRKKIAVHRAVVWPQSPRLKDLTIVEKNQYEEALSYTIDLTHEDSLAVKVMVYFLYFSVYPQREDYQKFGVFDRLRFSHHLLVRDLAKKFVLPVLALLAKEHFIEAVEKSWNIYIFYDCIPVIYGEQPEPDSTLRKIAAQKSKLDLEWDTERSDLWHDFHRYVQEFPLFACDVLAALYPIPIPKPDLTLTGGSKGSWDVEPGHVPIRLDEIAPHYDAVLVQTNPRGVKNEYYCLRILRIYVDVLEKGYFVTHVRYRKVGESETKKTLVETLEGCLQESKSATEYFSDAVDVFEEKFKDLTGLDWANRSSQPVKSKYTYIGESRNGVLSGWDNAVSKPFLFDVSKTSTSIRLLTDGLIKRSKTISPRPQHKAKAPKKARVAAEEILGGNVAELVQAEPW